MKHKFSLHTILGFVRVGFEVNVYISLESQGLVELSVVVTDPPSGAPRPFSLSLNTVDETAGV